MKSSSLQSSIKQDDEDFLTRVLRNQFVISKFEIEEFLESKSKKREEHLKQFERHPFFEEAAHKPRAGERGNKTLTMAMLLVFDATTDQLYNRCIKYAAALQQFMAKGLEGVSESDARGRLVKIERLLGEWSKGRKIYGPMFDDILKLKDMHQRIGNYLRWLKWKG